MRRNHGREIQLKRREMAFPWISVGGNDVMRRNGERKAIWNAVKWCFHGFLSAGMAGWGGTMEGKSS